MKQKHTFFLQTKDYKVRYSATTRDEAFAMFFLDVEKGNITLEEIGTIVMLNDPRKQGDKGNYPFRTAPILFQMKLLSASVATSNIMAATGVTQKEADQMLLQASFNDSRILPIMAKLREVKH
jgi:hypothetical protein